MEEKVMVSDILNGVKAETKMLNDMILESGNKELKQTLKQFRNQNEISQEEIYQIARAKQYYVPAAQATAEEIKHVKTILERLS